MSRARTLKKFKFQGYFQPFNRWNDKARVRHQAPCSGKRRLSTKAFSHCGKCGQSPRIIDHVSGKKGWKVALDSVILMQSSHPCQRLGDGVTVRDFPHPRTKPKVYPEKRTRMPPSEALKIGRMQYPNVTDKWVEDSPNGDKAFCAVGLINYIRGDSLDTVGPLNKDGKVKLASPCNCKGWDNEYLGHIVMHLSDMHEVYPKSVGTLRRIGLRFSSYPIFTQAGIVSWLESIHQ